jgi:hypothetical protein
MMRRYRCYLIGLAVAVVLLGAYAAAGFLAVPYYARRGAQEFVRAHYGRTLRLDEVHFNPFTLTLDLKRLALPDADGQPLLGFDRLHVELQLASLWRLGVSFHNILFERPYVRAVLRPGGELNLADLGKGFAPAPAAPEKKSAPLRLFISRLAVITGAATFEDHTRPIPFRAEFKPISFELRDFSTLAGSGNTYALNAASPDGERLIWSGTVSVTPLASHGVFEIADLKARTLWNYLRDSVPFEIAAGVIGIKGDYDLEGSRTGSPTLQLNVRRTLVTSLGLRPRGGAQDYIDVASIAVDDTRLDLAHHAVKVAKVALSGGDIKAWFDDRGQLNLLELARGGESTAPSSTTATAPSATALRAPPPPAPEGTAPAANGERTHEWTVAIPDVAFQGFVVTAEDRRTRPAAALRLAPLNVHVGGFDNSPGATLAITLDSLVNDSGKINAHAQVTPQSTAVSGHLEAESLDLRMLQPYFAQYTSMTLLQGTLGAKLDVERRADSTLTLSGNTYLADLRAVDNALKQDFLKWKGLRMAGIRYVSRPASLRIGTVTALEPYVRMIIAPDRSVNIATIMKPSSAVPATSGGAAPAAAATTTATSTPSEPSEPGAASVAAHPGPKSVSGKVAAQPTAGAAAPTSLPMSIGTVRFVNASLNYADLWIKPSFAVGIQELNGTVTGLSSDPQSRAKVDLNGKVERYSPARIAGEVNLLSAALYTDITMSFKDIDLTIVNPYSGHFAGYRIDKGKLSFDVSYHIEQRRLDAKQHFLVDQLELGDRVDSPDAVHLPLKIAVALLKDRDGVIDLDLPLTGTLDDPQFRIGPIVWKMFVNLIVKVAASPFTLLGHLFGGGNEHMNVIEFDGGSAELDKPASEQLASVARALTERPQLKLDVPIIYSPGIDRPQLAATRVRTELLARVLKTRAGKKHPDTAGELALADPEKHFGLLVEQYQTDLGRDATLPPSALAVQQTKRGETPPYEEAIADLNAALIDHVLVPDSDLAALGKQRAQAIQAALLSGGQIDAARVFIVNSPPLTGQGARVRVELAVK